MFDDFQSTHMSTQDRFNDIARILAQGIIRLKQSRLNASKNKLLQSTLQSETCTSESG